MHHKQRYMQLFYMVLPLQFLFLKFRWLLNTVQEWVTWICLAYQQPHQLNWQPIGANKPHHILTVHRRLCQPLYVFAIQVLQNSLVWKWIIPWCCKYKGGLKSSFFWKYSSTQLNNSGWLPSALVGRWKSTNWHLKQISPQQDEI